MTVFDRTKKISKLRGFSLQKTAEKAGLSQNAIYNWKTKEPSNVSLKAVASVLGVSTDYLTGKTDDFDNNDKNNEDAQTFFRVDLSDIDPDKREKAKERIEKFKEFLMEDM
ncbi:Transcriptional regulator [Fructobacillus evanidus]|uniref:Contains XRE-family HTH domain (HipB) n=1 Tax=Fructobacillus evanidus TaxID=3064281 RepID=A0ABM9N2M4_9LACO|nr:Transcriptional regulator [Fructobacillus sp. LMG 32999]CAK1255233.1 Transcriptional regulator [Fructobacillus sp. LMG 32999]